jgi:iron(III) transport system ATP-binding protein
MSHGQVAQLDEPRELYKNPKDIDVARFLGQSNEIVVSVESFDPTANVVTGAGAVGTVTARWKARDAAPPPVPGDELVVFGRPADFILGPATGTPENRDNEWEGTIEAARFLGTHTEYVVEFGEARIRCWSAAEGVEAFEESRRVRVTVDPGALQAIPEA